MSPRQKTSTLLVLSLLVVATIGYFAFSGGGDDPTHEAIETNTTGGAESPPVVVDAEPDAEAELAAPAPQTERSDAVEEALASEAAEAEAQKQYITGQVAFGFELPKDEELYVVSLRATRTANALYGEGGIVESIWGSAEKHSALLDHSRVAADGTFRVAVAKDAQEAHLALTGRYIFSMRSTRFPVESEAEDIILTGELGSWIRGILQAPRSQGDEVSLEKVAVELGPDVSASFDAMEIANLAYTAKVKSDAEGRFEFRGVSNSITHVVAVKHAELAAQLIVGIKPAAGERYDLEVGMQRGATLRGYARNDAGAGLAGAKVTVTLPGPLGSGLGELRETTTDADGAFELPNVLTGRTVQINATLENYVPGRHKLNQKLRDGQVLDKLDVLLSQGSGIAGRVLYPDGTPAESAKVTITADFSKTDAAMMGARVGMRRESTAETSAEGAFEVLGLSEGEYMLAVQVENETGDHPGSWRARAGGVPAGNRSVVLELEGLSSIAGRLLTESDVAIGKFTVHVLLKGSGGTMGFGAESGSETFENPGDGSFKRANTPPGVWEVTVRAQGFALSATQEIEVPQPADAPLPEFWLEPSANIAGTVFDSLGSPVSGAKVSLEQDLASRINNAFTGESPTTFSDHEGKYLLAELNPGVHSVIAKAQGFAGSQPRGVELQTGQTVADIDLQLRVGGTLVGQVLGDDGEPAVGRMVIVQSVPSYASQHMQATDSNGEFRVEHLEPGPWQVVSTPNFMTGELDIEGGQGMSEMMNDLKMDMVDIVDGDETFVLLGKPPEDPIEILGSVVHDGQPLGNSMVTFLPEGSQGLGDIKITAANAQGHFNLKLDKRGAYLVTVQNDVQTGLQNSIEFQESIPAEGETYRMELELPIARVSGRVIDVDGKPAAKCRVTLNVDGGVAYGSFLGGHYTEMVTKDDGTYEIKYLRPGNYTVSAGGATMSGLLGNDSHVGRVVQDEIVVAEGQWVKDVNFKLKEPCSITGIVRGADDKPVAGAGVFVRDARGRLLDRISMVATDGAGKFMYPGVAEGEYRISARKGGLVSQASALVTVKSGESVSANVVLEGGTTFIVTVVDKNDEEIHARISVKDDAGHEMSGMFTMHDLMQKFETGFSIKQQPVGPLAPGKYQVEAILNDGRVIKKSVQATGQEERKIKLRI